MAITLTAARRERLGKFLTDVYADIKDRRHDRERSWQSYLDRYEAKTVPKNIPFVGASSLHSPIVAIAVDSIKTRVMNALFGQDRLLRGIPLTDATLGVPDPATGQELTWRDVAEKLEQYLSFEIGESGQVDLHGAIEELVDELVLLGTGVLKTFYDVDYVKDYTPDGKATTVKTYDNVRFAVPSLTDIYIPPGYDSLDRVPLVGQRYLMRSSEMKTAVETRLWDKAEVDRFLASPFGAEGAEIDVLQETQDALERVGQDARSRLGEHWMCESWVRFDLDGDGHEARLLVDHALDDPTFIFRISPWPYAHGQLPFGTARYIKRRKRFYGMGVPERLEAMDEGLSTTLNQMVDNATLANTRMWSVDAGSVAARELDRIWPGKKIPRSNKDDIVPLQMGEVYPSIFEQHNVLNALAEKLSKLSDYNLGRESQALGRQSTATATMALLQESGQYFDNITRDVRNAVNKAFAQWIELLVQFKPFSRIREVMGQDADVLIAALSLDPGQLRKRVAVMIAFSTTAATQEIARQEEASKWQVLEAYFEKLIQLAQMRLNPLALQMPGFCALVDQIAKDADVRIRRLLEAYGDSYNNTTLPSWEATIVNGAQIQQQQQQQQAAAAAAVAQQLAAAGGGAPGGGGLPPQLGGQPGMGGLLGSPAGPLPGGGAPNAPAGPDQSAGNGVLGGPGVGPRKR